MRRTKVLAMMLSAVVVTTSTPAAAYAAPADKIEKQLGVKAADLFTQADYEEIKIPDAGDIRGNLTLKKVTSSGAKVTWKSSDESIISTKATGKKAAGIVNRPADRDKKITLTATLTKDGDTSELQQQELTVKKKAEKKVCSEYLFAHFTGTEGKATDEQIYFATSKDAESWTDLNEKNPVLTSNIGDKGVRDPYLLRSAEGDKFYLIATDLSIYNRGGWGKANATKGGSLNLVVWESTDLVNWSEPRLVDIASKIAGAGCAWAPEAIYDEESGQYVVYWATGSDESNKKGDRMNMYYATTRDFRTFSKPVLWIDRENSIIDTTMIKADGKYYRASGDGQITIEESDSIYDGWKIIGTLKDIFNNDNYSGAKLEGPEFFKYNDDDALKDKDGNPVETWGLMCDQYSAGKGYLPFRTTNLADLSTQCWSTANDVDFGALKKRHGTILNITKDEYNAITKKWSDFADEKVDASKQAPVADFNFENGSEDVTLNGNAKIEEDDDKNSNVLKLDGTAGSFAQLPGNLFEGRNQLTISMDVKPEMDTGNYFTFGLGQSDQKYLFLKMTGRQIKSVITRNTYRSEHGVTQNIEESTKNRWQNVKMVINGQKLQVYVDNVLVGTNDDIKMTVSELGKNLSAYLGKSFYSGDAYFKGAFDNIKVYNRALSEKDIQNETELVTLKDMAAGVKKLDKNRYTQESYEELKMAAEKLEALSYPTQAEQTEVEKVFYNALAGLEVKGNTSYTKGLKIVIQAAEKIKQQNYTKNSYDQLQNVLKAAREAAKNSSLTKKQAAVHITSIQKAMDGLKTVQVANVTGLKSASNKTTSLKLSWKKAAGVSSYELYRYNSRKKEYDKIKIFGAFSTSYTDKKLKSGTSYTYQIRVKKTDGGISYYGAFATLKTATAPEKVLGLKVKKASGTKIKLNWKKVKGSSGYTIYMKTGNGKYKKVKTITKGTTAKYTKIKLKKGNKYSFKIRAYKKADKNIYGSYSSSKTLKLK